MNATLELIGRIQDVFDGWRELGSRRLADGTELLVRQPVDGEECWMHAVFPRLDAARLDEMAGLLGRPLPASLRRFYGACGGMVLFGGLFRVFGLPRHRGLLCAQGPVVDDIVAANHLLDSVGALPAAAIAVARNDWDGSIHLAGVGDDADEIVRVDRSTGEVIGRASSMWELVADKLYGHDPLLLG